MRGIQHSRCPLWRRRVLPHKRGFCVTRPQCDDHYACERCPAETQLQPTHSRTWWSPQKAAGAASSTAGPGLHAVANPSRQVLMLAEPRRHVQVQLEADVRHAPDRSRERSAGAHGARGVVAGHACKDGVQHRLGEGCQPPCSRTVACCNFYAPFGCAGHQLRTSCCMLWHVCAHVAGRVPSPWPRSAPRRRALKLQGGGGLSRRNGAAGYSPRSPASTPPVGRVAICLRYLRVAVGYRRRLCTMYPFRKGALCAVMPPVGHAIRGCKLRGERDRDRNGVIQNTT